MRKRKNVLSLRELSGNVGNVSAENSRNKTSKIMQGKETKNNLIAEYYSQHYEELKAYVTSRLSSSSDDAEDIVQNTFYRLLRTDKMITSVTLPALVYTIARNLICDSWRRRQCKYGFEHEVFRGERLASGYDDAEVVCSVDDVKQVLENGIARLDERCRKIYRLNIEEDMPVSEIAIRLDIGYKIVEHRLANARKEVRKYMRSMLA